MNQASKIGFIVGVGRSGTTLFASMLNRHPSIAVTPETGFFVHLYAYPAGIDGFQRDWPESLTKIVDKMHPTSTWSPAEWAERYAANRSEFPGIKGIFFDLCENFARIEENVLILEKTPDHLLYLTELREHFPDAPILNIVRDGRAVAESRARQNFLPEDQRSVEYSVLLWADHVHSANIALASDPRALQLRYEELLNDPDKTLRGVCDFLQLEYTEKLLYPDGSEEGLVELGTEHKNKIFKRLDPGLADGWKKILPEEAKAISENLAARELKRLGYDLLYLPDSAKTIAFPDTFLSPDILKVYKGLLARMFAQNNNLYLGDMYSDPLPRESSCDYILLVEIPEPESSGKNILVYVLSWYFKEILGRRKLILFCTKKISFSQWRSRWLAERFMRMVSKSVYAPLHDQ